VVPGRIGSADADVNLFARATRVTSEVVQILIMVRSNYYNHSMAITIKAAINNTVFKKVS